MRLESKLRAIVNTPHLTDSALDALRRTVGTDIPRNTPVVGSRFDTVEGIFAAGAGIGTVWVDCDGDVGSRRSMHAGDTREVPEYELPDLIDRDAAGPCGTAAEYAPFIIITWVPAK